VVGLEKEPKDRLVAISRIRTGEGLEKGVGKGGKTVTAFKRVKCFGDTNYVVVHGVIPTFIIAKVCKREQ